MANMIKSAPLERLLKPVGRALNDVASKKLLRVRADRPTQRRLAILAEKCNEGILTPQERLEYEELVAAGQVVATLQAQARLKLSKAARSS